MMNTNIVILCHFITYFSRCYEIEIKSMGNNNNIYSIDICTYNKLKFFNFMNFLFGPLFI